MKRNTIGSNQHKYMKTNINCQRQKDLTKKTDVVAQNNNFNHKNKNKNKNTICQLKKIKIEKFFIYFI